MKPLRLTLVISSLARGGAERVMSMLASLWAQQGRQVTILRFDHGETPAYPLDSRVEQRSLSLLAYSSNPAQGLLRNLRRVRVLRRAIRDSRPDIVISFQSATNILTLLATRRLGVPVIIAEHSEPSRSRIGKLWKRLRRLTYPRASALVCPTRSAVDYFQARIKVSGYAIPNLIAVPPAELMGDRISQDRTSKAYTLIGMGRLVQSKGFDILLDVFSRIASFHPEWSLKIIGDGPVREELQRQALALGIANRVEFTGELADPFPELCAADLFVFPSRFEAFGLALCEAMACGLPVVSFDCPCGPGEIIRDGVDGILVPAEDAGALSKVLHRLMDDPVERERLSARAPEVMIRFDTGRILSLWEELFDSILPSAARESNREKGGHQNARPAPLWLRVGGAFIRKMPVGRYRVISWLRRGPPGPFLVRTPKRLGGDTFQFSFHDQIARQIFLGGCYEPQESACVRDILRPGMSFVDVGANFGFFTLMGAHLVGTSGKVVAFEADPRVFAKLRENVSRNHLSQVQVFDVAVADRDGTVSLAGHDQAGGNPGISRLVENGSKAALTFSVRCCGLDPLLDQAGLEQIDLVKIDVEGAEDLVLAGMEQGLKSHRYGCVVLEIHPSELAERKRTVEELIEVLTGVGYRGYALNYFQAQRRAHYKPWLHFSEFIWPLERVEINGLKDSQVDLHTIWFSPNRLELFDPYTKSKLKDLNMS